MTALPGNAALEAWLAEALGAREARIVAADKLSGGAIQENWAVDAKADGVTHALVLRRDAPATIAASRTRWEEYALLAAVWAAGVTVPRPVAFCDDSSVFGAPFAVVERVPGVGYGPKVVRDTSLGGDRARLGRELGRQLARIHAIEADAELAGILGPRPEDPAQAEVKRQRASLDAMDAERLGLEWALRWAERHAPKPGEVILAHRDFRTGNFLVDETGLTAILDWEFADWSDPMADIGWFCAECWRFSRPDLEGGGVCERQDFYAGYQVESGRSVEPGRVRWWEIMAHLRWAVIALQQGHPAPQRRRALAPSRAHGAHGRRARAHGAPDDRAGQGGGRMTPEGLDLLDETAVTLRETLASQLSGEARYLALLAANAVLTARREAEVAEKLATARAALPERTEAIRSGAHDEDAALYARLLAHAALRAWIADESALTDEERATYLEEPTA